MSALSHQTADASLGTLPNFLIIGAQRSGTTSLARHLSNHPQVFVAPQKEVHYFDRHLERGVGWYREQFAGATESVVGEATPEYMYLPDVPAKLAEVVPKARLMATLRNPVDRAYSQYWFQRGRGVETLSFEEAIQAEKERLRSGTQTARDHFSYTVRGHYLLQLRNLCEHFPRAQLQVHLFEDFRNDPVAVIQGICRFLGIDDTFVPPRGEKHFGASRTYRSRSIRKLSRRLPYPLNGVLARLNSRQHAYSPMDPSLRSQLIDHFREDNEALGKWLDLDLSAWNK